MKLNNKGFAITGILYFVLIMFLMIISSLLLMLKTRINRLTDLNDTINSEVELKENIVDVDVESYITNLRGKYIFQITKSMEPNKNCYSYLPKNSLLILQDGIIKYKIPTLDSNGNYMLDSNDLTGATKLSLYDGYDECDNSGITSAKIISISSSVDS